MKTQKELYAKILNHFKKDNNVDRFQEFLHATRKNSFTQEIRHRLHTVYSLRKEGMDEYIDFAINEELPALLIFIVERITVLDNEQIIRLINYIDKENCKELAGALAIRHIISKLKYSLIEIIIKKNWIVLIEHYLSYYTEISENIINLIIKEMMLHYKTNSEWENILINLSRRVLTEQNYMDLLSILEKEEAVKISMVLYGLARLWYLKSIKVLQRIKEIANKKGLLGVVEAVDEKLRKL